MFTKKLPGMSSLGISESVQVMRCLKKEENFYKLQKLSNKTPTKTQNQPNDPQNMLRE